MNHDHGQSEPLIPEPTTFEQARRDGVAERIASGDTEGGKDQFETLERKEKESLSEEGNRTLRSGQEGAGQDQDDAPSTPGHGVGSRLSNTEAATGGGGTSTF